MVAGCVRRIQGEFGQETFSRRISGGDLFELEQISLAGLGISWMRSRYGSYQKRAAFEINGPFRISSRLIPSSRLQSAVASRHRPEIDYAVFSPAGSTIAKPTPPSPLFHGSSALKAKAVATAASAASVNKALSD